MKFGFRIIVLILFSLILTTQFQSKASAQFFANSDQGYKVPVAENEIKIMSYNVENLFNTVSNEGKRDWTWLPIAHPLKGRCSEISNPFYREACETTDWTDNHLMLKLQQFARALQAQGDLPDIIGLQEVESEDVVAFLSNALGYKYVFVDGPDNRGIDVALMYRERNLQLLHFDSIDVSQRLGRNTRDILRVHFQFRGIEAADVLTILVNHWPSQGGPTANRIVAAQVAQQAIEEGMIFVGDDNYHVIALGDFNVLPLEQPHPVRDFLQSPQWQFSLLDVHQMSDQSNNPMNGVMPVGSYYFARDDAWNRFDKILVSKNLRDGSRMEVLPESYRVVAPTFMTMTYDTGETQAPKRYNFKTLNPVEAGFSDHFPVAVKVRLW